MVSNHPVHTCLLLSESHVLVLPKRFSFVSIATSVDGLNGRSTLIKEEPIDPAPPITNTDFPSIFSL